MNLYIKNTYGNRPATSYDMAEYLLGSRKAKMPAKGMPIKIIQGITVWVEPLLPKEQRKQRFALRVMCQCPECGFVTAVGRLAQHAKIHKE